MGTAAWVICIVLAGAVQLSGSWLECGDKMWCSIPMPNRSHFRFEPPTDADRWRVAQIQAARGDQVLMKRARAVFPNQMDFIDGDELFRGLNNIVDLHIDHNKDLTLLTLNAKMVSHAPQHVYNWATLSNASHPSVVIPGDYDIRGMDRAPVVMVGYYVFARKRNSPYFTGPHVGEAIIDRPRLYKHFNAVKETIAKPFILLHGANENWGIMSTEFPNRTIDWGQCCQGGKTIHAILNHPKLVMFLHTQHHNVTHPKLITLPRGIAISWERKRNMLWELLHSSTDTVNKTSLVFSATSAWKHRPYIKQCIESKFSASDGIEVTTRSSKNGQRVNEKVEWDYYRRMISARVTIALPGLGYDTFRFVLLHT
jgi:hypothetical protein